MSSFAKICSCEIFEILSFAKICSREMTKKFICENKFSRKLIPLRYIKTKNADVISQYREIQSPIGDPAFVSCTFCFLFSAKHNIGPLFDIYASIAFSFL